MGKHAVEHDAHAHFFRLGAQRAEVRLRAEGRVDLHVVAGIVFMVALGAEDGVQVQRRHAQRARYTAAFPRMPFKLPPKKSLAVQLPRLSIDDQRGIIVPAGVIIRPRRQLFTVKTARVAEAIHHDLHHQPLAHPPGRIERGVVYRQLEGCGLIAVAARPRRRGCPPHCPDTRSAACSSAADEIIPQQPGLFRYLHFIFIHAAVQVAHMTSDIQRPPTRCAA